MVSEGAPGSPQGRPKDPQGPPKGAPESPKGSPRSSWGSPCPPKGPPKTPPGAPSTAQGGQAKTLVLQSENLHFRGSMVGTPLGCSCGPFFSSSASSRFVFRCLWAPRSPFTSSLPVLAVNWLPPGSPKAAPGRQNVPFYAIKPMILQCRLFSKSGL